MKRIDLSAFKYEAADGEPRAKRPKREEVTPKSEIPETAASAAPAAPASPASRAAPAAPPAVAPAPPAAPPPQPPAAAGKASAPEWPGPLQPILEPGLRYVFVGFNPGVESAKQGHHYAHPSNRFWKLLHWSGLTPRKLACQEDRTMPKSYGIGFTDLVARSTKGIQQLSRQEMAAGVDWLDERIGGVRPQVVCFVGKGIWEAVARARGWDRKQFRYGLDEHHRFGHDCSLLCCVPSTSGLTSISIEKQLGWWREVASLAPTRAARP